MEHSYLTNNPYIFNFQPSVTNDRVHSRIRIWNRRLTITVENLPGELTVRSN